MTPNKIIIGLVFAITIVVIIGVTMMLINWSSEQLCKEQQVYHYQACLSELR